MKKKLLEWKRIAAYGLLMWIISSLIDLIILQTILKIPHSTLWAGLLNLMLIILLLIFTTLYIKNNPETNTREGVIVGLMWFVIYTCLDLAFFSIFDPAFLNTIQYIVGIILYTNTILIPGVMTYVKEEI